EKSAVARRQVTSSALGEPRQAATACIQCYFGPHHVTVPQPNQLDSEPVMAGVGFIAQHPDRFIHVTDYQVWVAIVIEVAHGQSAPTMCCLKIATAAIGNLHEPALTRLTGMRDVLQQYRSLRHAEPHVAEHMTIADNKIFPAVIV